MPLWTLKTVPMGAIYVNNYAGYRTSVATASLVRFEYIGNCHPQEPKLETISTRLYSKANPVESQFTLTHGRTSWAGCRTGHSA